VPLALFSLMWVLSSVSCYLSSQPIACQVAEGLNLRWPRWAEVLPGYAVGSLGHTGSSETVVLLEDYDNKLLDHVVRKRRSKK